MRAECVTTRASRASLLVFFLLLGAAPGALAASFNITSGTTTTAQTLGSGSGQTGNIAAAGTLSVSGSTVAVTISGNSATLNNLGTINQTGTGRDIRDNTGVTNLIINNGSTTNSTALMQAADADVIQMNKSPASVTLNNYGSMVSLNASGGGSQAVDFSAIASGSNTINNFATGIMQASEADAVRPGVNGVVYNAGLMKAATTTGSSSDGVDAQNNSGVQVTNDTTGTIEGARHGITGGALDATVTFTTAVTNNLGGVIKGDNGSGINLDGFNALQSATIINNGTILGNGVTGDGDGIDVDGIVNVTNTGTIRSLNAFSATTPAQSEGITVGGGTITNSGTIEGLVAAGNTNAAGRGISLLGNDITTGPLAGTREAIYGNATITNNSGGLIRGDSDSGIAVDGPASGFVVTINNKAGGTIMGGGALNAAIVTGADNDVISNSGTIDGSSSGRAIAMGAGNDTLNLFTGSTIKGAIDGGAGTDTLHLAGTGSGTLGVVSNIETLNVAAGHWVVNNAQSYSGGGAIAVGAALQVDHTSAAFGGTFIVSGTLASDPSALTFNDLSIDPTGHIEAAPGDLYKIGGDFLNHSTQNALWDTSTALLEFTGLSGTLHDLLLTGSDLGGVFGAFVDNFAWNQLLIDVGNELSLQTGAPNGRAFYASSLVGAVLSGNDVTNIFGNGFDIYYNADVAGNAYLNGRTYQLLNGGELIAVVPEPGTFALLLSGLGVLVILRRRRNDTKAL